MKQCDHPNLVKLYAVCTNEAPYFIITEYMQNGSLLVFLRNEANMLNNRCLIDMASQIANGMQYLEERRLVHRDLAARNVLVGEVSLTGGLEPYSHPSLEDCWSSHCQSCGFWSSEDANRRRCLRS